MPSGSRSFDVLRFMAALKAARDFGLDRETADAAALRFDPRRGDPDRLVDHLADALLQQRALDLPDAL